MICADPDLSRADEKLAAAYQAGLGALSDEGRAEFRRSQLRWLRYTDIVCSTDPTSSADPPEAITRCLRDEYEERQKQLETAVVKRDGLVIRRVDIFKASASAVPHEDGHANFTTTTVGYPQIDKPRDAGEQHWNARMLLQATPRHGRI